MQNPESPNPNNPPDLSKAPPPPATPPSPPSNPYETSGSMPYSAPQSPQPVPMGAPVSTDVIGQAWEILKPQIGMWIVAMLIYAAVSGAFNGISIAITAIGGDQPSAIINVLNTLISVAGAIVGFLIAAGLIKMAIHHVRSGQADIAKLFDITDVIAPIIIAGIVVTLATILGFVLLIIPGVIIALGFSMYTPIIVDQKASAIEAIKRSWETCKPHLGALFLLYLVLGLLNIAGACACGLGLFITFPLTQIAIALTYRNLFGIGRAESGVTPSVFPPPPIASPSN